MKRIGLWFLYLLIILSFSACGSTNTDTSGLIGEWRSTGTAYITVETNSNEATRLIEEHMRALCFDNSFIFYDDGRINHIYTRNNEMIAEFTGTYFRRDEILFIRYSVLTNLGITTSYWYTPDNNNRHMTLDNDVTDKYDKNDMLISLGIIDPADIIISRAIVTYNYEKL